MKPTTLPADRPEPTAHFSTDVESEGLAWEEIEEGRYMPRRIRGSFRGRALG